MKFCSKCDNMLYTKLLSKDSEELVYYCRNCNTNEAYHHEDLCVSKINYKRGEQKYQHSINAYTKLDPTLPRTKAIKCPNLECISNNEEEKREVIIIRYDETNVKYVYLCAHCDTIWKNFENEV